MQSPAWASFYGDVLTKRYHTAECPARKTIKSRNLKVFASEAESGARGYYPCTACIPPVGKESLPIQEQRRLSQPVSRGAAYIGDSQKQYYHYGWCQQVKNLPPERIRKFASVEKADAAGYTRCPGCNPPPPLGRGQDLQKALSGLGGARDKPAESPTGKRP